MAQLEPYRGGYYLWHYVPSLAAAVIALICFILITAAHVWKLYKFRLWFCLPFAIGGLMEMIGYIARCKAHNATGKLMPYVIQNTFTLLPPILFAASIYMILGRIIRAAGGERYSIVPVRILTKTFVWGDVISFLVQGGGAGMMATGTSLASMGQDIVIGGLVLQIVMFGLFAITAMTFHYRYQHVSVQGAADRNPFWKQSLFVLYGVSALIMIRSIFRVIEFILGTDGYIMSHEWTLYVFDALLMLIVMILFYVYYPNQLRPEVNMHQRVESTDDMLNSDSVIELGVQGKGGPRSNY